MQSSHDRLRITDLLKQGLELHQQGWIEQAQDAYDQILSVQPDNFDALQLSGALKIQRGDYENAITLLNTAVLLNPYFAPAHNNLGFAHAQTQQLEFALEHFNRAIALDPAYAEAHRNRAQVFNSLQRSTEALADYQRAIILNPQDAKSLKELGDILYSRRGLEEALRHYDAALSINPQYIEAWSNRGATLRALGRHEQAIESYDTAIALYPNFTDAHNNRANALKDLKRLDEALASYQQAYSTDTQRQHMLEAMQFIKLSMCLWDDYDEAIEQILNRVKSREPTTLLFALLAITDDPSIQKIATEVVVEHDYPANPSLGVITQKFSKERIKIAYFSADFGEHPVAYLAAELFETHNKEKFETFAFSFGINQSGQMHERIKKAFDHFYYVDQKSDEDIATLARALDIDIAIDLGGFTDSSRTGIFAYRVAPIQMSYLGYLGTMGSPYYDYLIADQTIIPAEAQQHYSEKIIYLPSYQSNDRQRIISSERYTRSDWTLPDEAFVFCCFNNNYKITPYVFKSWLKILAAVEGSVLFLLADNPWVEVNLKKTAQAMGVDPNRLIFGGRLNRDVYLARYQACDLFLDTWPYNAGTTASDALWAGLPVLTLMGNSFASRVAASLLNAIDLPALITATRTEYESRAIELAHRPEKLRAIKQTLVNNRLTCLLFDTPRFTNYLEQAYQEVLSRYHDKVVPDHLYVTPSRMT